MFEPHRVAWSACQGPMGPRDIKSIHAENRQLHLEPLYAAFWLNGNMLGLNGD